APGDRIQRSEAVLHGHPEKIPEVRKVGTASNRRSKAAWIMVAVVEARLIGKRRTRQETRFLFNKSDRKPPLRQVRRYCGPVKSSSDDDGVLLPSFHSRSVYSI